MVRLILSATASPVRLAQRHVAAAMAAGSRTQAPDVKGAAHNNNNCQPSSRSFHVFISSSPASYHNTTSSSSLLVEKRSFSSGASKRDFYEVLGVPKSADKASVKKAYFKLAKQYHPDTNQGDNKAAEKFKECTEAYEVLSDEEKRGMYDQFGHAGVDPNAGFGGDGGNPFEGFGQGGGGNPFGGFGGFQDGSFHFSSGPGGGAQEIDPEELFETLFGARSRPRGPQRGADLQMHVELTFEEAVFGCKKDLNLRYQIRNNKSGRVETKNRNVEVDIPKGIDSGMSLRLQGQGAEGDPGAQRGNLMLTVVVKEDDYFTRDGINVHTEVPISFTQAILGGTVDVKTLSGEVEMKIPKGTQPNKKMLMRGKGITRLNSSSKGDHVVHLKVELPTKLSSHQEDLLREFDEETARCGNGIAGRLAEAVDGFSKIFGSMKSKKGSEENKKTKQKSKKAESDDEEDEDETLEKKAAT
mmetsp:Transcript_39471/g.58613  ORF Transcript_39471/g.58613 Transcript_39471/m.58613 type:complete len:470 (-) Transcript_39471:101-1510(-)|eukprot:CAMPEP_0194052048 /NCGR_PEP_ID=MMETSP0009_2-20130614/43682_1 /TAXON_ID=210454 /ORGANISM="Grammatophora oceanica, Strain CCMP 410" /LENGTH=469 /DNA_ID=CAMNT_0038699431 /DNA_START=51 /DNA_END=1460 /DNA_ORIENTATION=+